MAPLCTPGSSWSVLQGHLAPARTGSPCPIQDSSTWTVLTKPGTKTGAKSYSSGSTCLTGDVPADLHNSRSRGESFMCLWLSLGRGPLGANLATFLCRRWSWDLSGGSRPQLWTSLPPCREQAQGSLLGLNSVSKIRQVSNFKENIWDAFQAWDGSQPEGQLDVVPYSERAWKLQLKQTTSSCQNAYICGDEHTPWNKLERGLWTKKTD